GQGRRKSAQHAGRGVRPRRNRAHPRGKAWSAIDQAGHRHRTVEGASVGRQASAANLWTQRDETQGQQRPAQSEFIEKAIDNSRAGHAPSTETRGTLGGLAIGVVTSGEERGAKAAREGVGSVILSREGGEGSRQR